MNIQQATRSFESWMRSCTTVIESDLRSKHEKMKGDLFMFFRGTFYRWAQLWPEVCTDLLPAPKVLGVGDLHVNSFGTWRDAEGRMAWGVDDFDESYPLPYTSDLVRLAASVKIVNDLGDLNTSLKKGCEIVLQGYETTQSWRLSNSIGRARDYSGTPWYRGDRAPRGFLGKAQPTPRCAAWIASGREAGAGESAARRRSRL